MDIVERMQRDLDLGLSASIGDTKKAIAEIKRLRDELKFTDEVRQSALQSLLTAENEIERLQVERDKCAYALADEMLKVWRVSDGHR